MPKGHRGLRGLSFILLAPLIMACTRGRVATKPFLEKAEDDYAAYFLRAAYHEGGYLGASVRVHRVGPYKLFTVNPGPKYRLKEVRIVGVKDSRVAELLADAPKPGELYSPDRVSNWSAGIMKKYSGNRDPLLFLKSRTEVDHKGAQVTVTLAFKERS